MMFTKRQPNNQYAKPTEWSRANEPIWNTEIEDKYINKEIAKVNLLYCLTKEYENEEKLKNIDTKTLCKIVTEIRKINIYDAWKGRVIIALIALTNEDFINL